MTVAEVVEAIRHFSDEEKAALAYTLYHTNTIPLAPMSREQALAELRTFNSRGNPKSLFGVFGKVEQEPNDEEINAYLNTLSKSWEEELNELGSSFLRK